MTAVGIRPATAGVADYRSAMRSQVCGLAVITTVDDGPVGFCASSLASVSLEPPLVSFAVCRASGSGRAWSRAEGGLVHLLHERQRPVASAFAAAGADRFGGRFPWVWSEEDYPELVDRLALLAIRTAARHLVGDHLVVIGAVSRVGAGDAPRRPLAYHDGAYCRVAPAQAAAPPHRPGRTEPSGTDTPIPSKART